MNKDPKWLNVKVINQDDSPVKTFNCTTKHLQLSVKYSDPSGSEFWHDNLPVDDNLTSSNISSQLVSYLVKYALSNCVTRVGGSNYQSTLFFGVSSSDCPLFLSNKSVWYVVVNLSYTDHWIITYSIEETNY